MRPNPTDRGRPGSKRHHVAVDRRGVPLALTVTGSDRHDPVAVEDLVDALQAVPCLPGRLRSRPDKLHADKGYDIARSHRHLRKRGICPRIARRGIENSDRLGKHRWFVERTLALSSAPDSLKSFVSGP
jgi:hypothetical protein